MVAWPADGGRRGRIPMATQAASGGAIDIGRVIQRGFQTLGRQFYVFFGLAVLLTAIPAIIVGLLIVPQALSAGAATDPTAALAIFASPGFWLSMLIAVLCSVLLQAAVVRASILDLRGDKVDIGTTLVESLKLILPMIGLSILTSIIVGIGLVLLIVPGIIAFIVLIVSVPALVGERKGVIESMSRSSELTKGTRGRIFLLLLIFCVLYWIASFIVGLLINPMMSSGSMTVALILQSIFSAVVSLVGAVMVASLYVELRMVKEGVSEQGLASIFA